MINILICDDDERFLKVEKEIIENIANYYGQEVWIDSYQSGEELVLSLEKKEDMKWCILLLDINMPKLSGYEVAKMINKRFSELLIIFVSNSEDLVFQAFEYKPFYFIRKSHFEKEIPHVLKKAFEVMEERAEKQISVVSKGEKVLLTHRDILYVAIQNRKMHFYLNDDRVLEVRGTLKGMLAELDDKRMIKINSGCAVNEDYIASYTADRVVMRNGEELYVSRDRAKEVKKWIEEKWKKL